MSASKAAVSPPATRSASSASGASADGAGFARVFFIRGIGCCEIEPRSRLQRPRRRRPLKPHAGMRSAQLGARSRHAQPITFRQADDRETRVQTRELAEPLVARLAVVSRQRDAEVVGIDLERYQ